MSGLTLSALLYSPPVPSRTDDLLASLAVERRLLTPEQLAELLAARDTDHRSLGELLLLRNLLTPAQLVELTAIAIERATQTMTPRTRTPRAAASDPTTARAVDELASDDKYELRGQIAEGGMGRILKAYDKRLRRHVAMKVIRTEHGLTADDLARFIDEAQATAQLEHPNIVPTHEVGLDHEGNLFFTMRLVKGRALRDIIDKLDARNPTVTHEFSQTRLLQIIQQICYALAYAHAKGVIHRDLKPENVMLGEFGEVLVMDWGLAKVFGRPDRAGDVRTLRTDADASKTLDGMVAGTPAYMAPEQARGNIADVDQQSDVFGVGAILYEMLTCRKPIRGQTTTDLLIAAAEGRVVPIETVLAGRVVPTEVLAIVRKAMAPNKPDRYANARALADDVQAYLEGRRGAAWQDTPLSLARKWVVRHKALSGVATAALVALVALSMWFYTRPGGATLVTDPAGAEITLDGAPIGRTPLELNHISAGEHTLTMRLADYYEQTQPISIGRGSQTRHTFIMKSVFAHFQIVTEPVANLTLTDANGALLDQRIAPAVFSLKQGAYKLTAYAPGYEPRTLTLQSSGGGLYRIETIKLLDDKAPLEGVVFPREAICTVTDVQTGQIVFQAPLPEKLPVPAAPIRVRFELANHFPQEFDLSPTRGEVVRVAASLAPMLWWRSGGLTGHAALGDLDGDGRPEIVNADTHARAFDGSGHLLWSAALPIPSIRPPAIAKGSVFVATATQLICLDGATGRTLWSADLPGIAFQAPICAPTAIICATDAQLHAFNPQTGAPIWTTPYDPSARLLPNGPTVARIRDGGLELYDIASGAVSAVRLDLASGFTVSDPTLTDSTAYVACDLDEQTSDVRACRLADGSLLWRRELEGRATPPVLAGETLWIATQGRLLYGLSAATGAVEAKIALPAPPVGVPALGLIDEDGVPDIVVTHDRGFIVISGATRRTLRSFTLAEGLRGSAACADLDADGAPEIVLTSKSGEVVVVRAAGSPWLWRQMAVATSIPPAVAGAPGREKAVLAAGDRDLLIIDAASGAVTRARVPDDISVMRCIAAGDFGGSVEWVVMDDRGTLATPRWIRRDLFRNLPVSLAVTPDVSRDGMADILVLWVQRVGIFSGADGSPLWLQDLQDGRAAELRGADVLVLEPEHLLRFAARDGKPAPRVPIARHPAGTETFAGGRWIAFYIDDSKRLLALDADGRETPASPKAIRAWSVAWFDSPDGPAILVSPVGDRPFVVWPQASRSADTRLGVVRIMSAASMGGEVVLGTSKGRVEVMSPATLSVLRSEALADDGAVFVTPFSRGVVALSAKSGCVGALRTPTARRTEAWGFDGIGARPRVFGVK